MRLVPRFETKHLLIKILLFIYVISYLVAYEEHVA